MGVYLTDGSVDVVSRFRVYDLRIVRRSEKEADAALRRVGAAAHLGMGVSAAAVTRGHDVMGQREARAQALHGRGVETLREPGLRIATRVFLPEYRCNGSDLLSLGVQPLSY